MQNNPSNHLLQKKAPGANERQESNGVTNQIHNITQFLYHHVKQNDFVIQLYDVSEENLKNLKNINKSFINNSENTTAKGSKNPE